MTLQIYTHVTQNTPAELGVFIGKIFPAIEKADEGDQSKIISFGVISGSSN